jgi:hypothetical protein
MASRPRQPGITGSPGKWQAKKPQVRMNVELGDEFALACGTSLGADMGDAVYHQHILDGELRITRTE